MAKSKHLIYADDQTEGIGLLLRLRLPILFVGLVLGATISIIVSRFEAVLAQDVSLAYFIPFIVYVSDAVGTQTQTIYIRNLNKKGTRFGTYLLKECLLGLIIGLIFGALVGGFTLMWLKSHVLALTVGAAMFASIATAPVVAILVTHLLRIEHQDPAVGAGPFTTVIQDMLSLLIYFGIASAIILR